MALAPDYYRNVFINCPFDPEFRPLFLAIVFTVADCGFVPRCALEADDSGDVRIQKIMNIIEQCCYGIHDISRTETTLFTEANGSSEALPRFNMPLELGMFIGAHRFGGTAQKRKKYVIFDTGRFRYRKFISDLAGQDIKAHSWSQTASEAKKELAIKSTIVGVRDWLNTKREDLLAAGKRLTGGKLIAIRYKDFREVLPELAEGGYEQDEADLTFYDLIGLIQSWLQVNPHA